MQENMTNTQEKAEKYLYMAFSLLKKRESIVLSDRERNFSDTEIRLLFEVLMAKYEDKRLISTQLAKNLGVTRSAVSQIVNHLEADGFVKRVADDVDRKIAYIEVTEETMAAYKEDVQKCQNFLNRVVMNFGEDNFYKMVELFNEFTTLLETEKKNTKNKSDEK